MTRVLGICGSLRAASYNRKLFGACRALLPVGTELDEFTALAAVPAYNADLDGDDAPAVVRDLRARIVRADALLIVTPEYNYSVPGALKNAIDWCSRPAGKSCLRRKRVAITGASTGPYGTARGQLALRQVFLPIGADVVTRPEVLIGHAASKFDDSGRLADSWATSLLTDMLETLCAQPSSVPAAYVDAG